MTINYIDHKRNNMEAKEFLEEIDLFLQKIAFHLKHENTFDAAVKLGVLMQKNMTMLRELKESQKNDEVQDDHEYGC